MLTKQAFPYIISTVPAALAITVAEARAQLKLGTDADTALDTELTLMIGAVTAAAEKYTRRDFITRTYTSYRDRLYGDVILRRNPVQSVTSLKYYKGGVLTLISDTLYYVTAEPDGYPHIALYDGNTWPSDVDERQQAIQIIFKCGYGDAEANIPSALRMSMLEHVAQLWTHRGDNDFPGLAGDAKPPAIARALYDKYRILEIS